MSKPREFWHPEFPAMRTTVYPTVWEGTLNYGLDVQHYKARFDNIGVTTPDPYAGLFPTVESVTRREANPNDNPWDGLGNVRKGMTSHVKVITLTPPHVIVRFGQRSADVGTVAMLLGDTTNQGAFAPFFGPWWTTGMGFDAILRRLVPADPNSKYGVQGGKQLGLRDYARKYSAVFHDWSRMDIIGVCRVLKPIRCFMGMGAPLHREDVKIPLAGALSHLSTTTTVDFDDKNVQLYIPNLRGHIGTFLSAPVVWSPEEVDRRLSQTVQAMARSHTPLVKRKKFVAETLLNH